MTPAPTQSERIAAWACGPAVEALPAAIDRVIGLVRELDSLQDVRALCETLEGGPANRVSARAV